ncbi:MAG: glycosyltransferase family 2 protein [Patescibacteria group bacterium]
MKKLISIVIPAYNEEEVVPELTKRLSKFMDTFTTYNFEVVVVEHGSKDKTLSELIKAHKKDKRIKILKLAKNEGCDGGIIAGLNFASGDAAVIMMADLQEPPELIPQFTEKWEEGYDIVYGIVKKRKKVPFLKIIGSLAFYRLMDFTTKGSLPENVSDFRLLDRRVYSVITKIPEHNQFFRGIAVWVGFKQIGIPFDRPERFAGKSKADYVTMFRVALNGIYSFSYITLLSPWMFGGFFGIATLIAFAFLRLELAVVLFGFTLICIILGIQNEYIKRIMDETRNRPKFIVDKTFGLSAKK